jgi:hypothetical protein
VVVRVVKWLVLLCCLLLLWYWWQCYTLLESGRGLLAQRPALPRLSVAVPRSVHFTDTSYTVTGSPSINADFIDRVLSAYGSPAAGTGQALYDLGVEFGIDPVYAPSQDHNDVEAYITAIEHAVQRWHRGQVWV